MRRSTGLFAGAFTALAQLAVTGCGGDGGDGTAPQTQVLHNFGADVPEAAGPSPILLGADGNFYGTALGGEHNDGIIFKMTPAGVETVMHVFDSASGDGNEPSPLSLGSDGNYYGTTLGGGAHGDGIVFEMTPDGDETVLYSFAGGGDAAYADSGVFRASDGFLYGASLFGGPDNKGTVFKVSPSGVETVLYSFGALADDPAGGFSQLVEGTDGNLYGASAFGGANNQGTVFKITPAGVLTVIYSFAGGSNDGSEPSGLLKGTDGNFYGVTVSGGPNSAGIVYRLTPTGVETIIYAFGAGPSLGIGTHPQGTLSEDSSGNFYGGTQVGGNPRTVCDNQGCSLSGYSGTLFEITSSGNAVLLSTFGPTDAYGTNPSGPPILGQDGNLYGTTSTGGASEAGVFYKVTL
jgi:uncharacterized repeat protein (TIGR03803 family)